MNLNALIKKKVINNTCDNFLLLYVGHIILGDVKFLSPHFGKRKIVKRH